MCCILIHDINFEKQCGVKETTTNLNVRICTDTNIPITSVNNTSESNNVDRQHFGGSMFILRFPTIDDIV